MMAYERTPWCITNRASLLVAPAGCCVKRVGSGKQSDRVTRDRTTDVRGRRVETRVDLMGSAVSVLD